MLGHSHALSGACAGVAAGLVAHLGPVPSVTLGALAAGAALIPDLDACGSCSARSLGWLSGLVSHVIRFVSGGHRHATHSLAGVAAFGALAWLACAFRHDLAGKMGLGFLVALMVSGAAEALHLCRDHVADFVGAAAAVAVVAYGFGLTLIPAAVVIGTAAHVAGDALTDSGVPLLFPLSQFRFRLLPEPLAFTTGTMPELAIVDPVLAVTLGWLGWLVAAGVR